MIWQKNRETEAAGIGIILVERIIRYDIILMITILII